MKFDKFLAKLFSRTMLIIMIATVLLALLLSSCVCTEEDCLLCFFCGCLTPETTCNIITCTNDCICDCTWGCADASMLYHYISCTSCNACDCVRDCMTDENGDPIDCGDVGCPECQKYFECE